MKPYKSFAFVLALLALVVAPPARAALVLSGPTAIPGSDSFYLTLSSDEIVEGVDNFTVTLTYSIDDAVTLTGAELGPGLPAFVASPDPGWTIGVVSNTLVQALYNDDLFLTATLPVGPLLKLTFAAATGPVTIQANLLPSSIDNGDLPSIDSNVVAVPEPSSWLLLAGGLAALSIRARRRRK